MKDKTARRRPTWRARAGLAVLMLLLGYGCWQAYLWWLRSEPLYKAADSIVQAFEKQDTGTLWFYSDLGEKEAFRFDGAKFARVFREYVWPHTKGLKRSKAVREPYEDQGSYLLRQYYLKGDREVFFDFIVYRTEDGPKAYVITPAVVTVFDIKYGQLRSDLHGYPWIAATLSTGALRDRQQLERLGITGQIQGPPGADMVPWNRLIPYWQESLRRRGIAIDTDAAGGR